MLDVLNSTGGLRCAATSGYSLAGFQPAPSNPPPRLQECRRCATLDLRHPANLENRRNAAWQPGVGGIRRIRSIRTDRVQHETSELHVQPGGLEESSRGLSAAIPPDADAKPICTPEGCQLNGIKASYWRFFDATESACIAFGPLPLVIASKSSWNFAPTFSSASERSGSLYSA